MATQDTFEHIVSALQDAALDPIHWAQATHLIDDACGLFSTHLTIHDTSLNPAPYLFSACYSHGEDYANLAQEYLGDYYPEDERVPRLFRLPWNRLTHNTALYTEHEQKTSVVYNECLPRIGSNNQLCTRLAGPTGTDILWGITKLAGADWPSANVALLQALLPHIHHSLHVHDALVRAEVYNPTLASLLDTRQIGAIFLNQRGGIIEANDRGQEILRHGNGLSDRGGVLRAQSTVDNAKLGKLLARALHGRPPVGGSMTLKRAGGCPPLLLHVSPITSRRLTFGAFARPVLVLVVSPSTLPSLDAHLVAIALGLTPSESEVAVSLAQGRTLRDIAVTTHREYSSVRWLIKQIYAKTGLTRQADLVRVVLSLADLPSPTA